MVAISVKKMKARKIYIQTSSYIDAVTGLVMTADFIVTGTTLDASSCRYSLYIGLTVGHNGRIRQRSVTHNTTLRAVVNKPHSDLNVSRAKIHLCFLLTLRKVSKGPMEPSVTKTKVKRRKLEDLTWQT